MFFGILLKRDSHCDYCRGCYNWTSSSVTYSRNGYSWLPWVGRGWITLRLQPGEPTLSTVRTFIEGGSWLQGKRWRFVLGLIVEVPWRKQHGNCRKPRTYKGYYYTKKSRFSLLVTACYISLTYSTQWILKSEISSLFYGIQCKISYCQFLLHAYITNII